MFRGLFFALTLVGPANAEAPRFTEVEIAPHIYDGGWEHFVGGGVAVFDCDNDEKPELFVAGGAKQAALFRNNSMDGKAISMKEETPEALKLTSVIGAYPIDIDSDGITDLVILRVGPNAFLKGGAECSFEPFQDLNVDLGDGWTTAFSATWEGGNTLPTLAFGNYVDQTAPDGPFGACDTNQLIRPNGEKYPTSQPLLPSFCPLSMLFSDWSRTGRADLRVSNDRHYYVRAGQEQMWAMEKTPRLYSSGDGWLAHELWGMGIASRDVTGDGLPDVMMTSMGDQRLQTRAAKSIGPTFMDVPFALGTTAQRPYIGGDGRPSTGWHVEFGDVDNDGLDDIFIAKGNVEQMPGLAMKDPNNLLLQQADGTFVEGGFEAGLDSLHRSRGASVVDLNGDGLLDIIVVNRRAPMEVHQNVFRGTGNWISIQLDQSTHNRHAVGAWIELDTGAKVVAREITVGGGHAGGKIGFEHFGLGSVETVWVRTIWPDQTESSWFELEVNKRYTLARLESDFRVLD